MLRAQFVCHQPYLQMEDQFERLLRRRRAAIAAGHDEEARGIAVVGASGSGKTTSVRRLFRKHRSLLAPEDKEAAAIVSLQVPSPATLKHVGYTMLNALGYPLQRDKPAAFIWDQVRTLLHRRKTMFVHLDEVQDLFTNGNPLALAAVLNTLKSLMNNPDWPVGLILSGMPKTVEMINSDDQLRRRVFPIYLAPISWAAHAQEIRKLFAGYVERAGLDPVDDLARDEFLARLVHAGANEFGLIVEMILGGIEEALHAGRTALTVNDFTQAFARKTGCLHAQNPFVAEDYPAIDARMLLGLTGISGAGG